MFRGHPIPIPALSGHHRRLQRYSGGCGFCRLGRGAPMMVIVLPRISDVMSFQPSARRRDLSDGPPVFAVGVGALLCVGSVTVSAPPDGGSDGGLELLPETMLQPRRYIGSVSGTEPR